MLTSMKKGDYLFDSIWFWYMEKVFYFLRIMIYVAFKLLGKLGMSVFRTLIYTLVAVVLGRVLGFLPI